MSRFSFIKIGKASDRANHSDDSINKKVNAVHPGKIYFTR